MHQIKDHLPPGRAPARIVKQVPPVFAGGAVELTFTLGTWTLKVASISFEAKGMEKYHAGMEYWYTTAYPSAGLTSLSMAYLDVEVATDSVFNTFFASLTEAFAAVDDVTGIEWSTGAARLPSGDHFSKFFTAPDPDDAARRIGLLLIFTAGGSLAQAVWFKQSDSASGYTGPIWKAANAPMHGLELKEESPPSSPNPSAPSAGDALVWFHLAEG